MPRPNISWTAVWLLIPQALKDYLIEEDVALEIMREVTRAKFKSYVQTAQKESQKDRKAAAASLRKLVQVIINQISLDDDTSIR